MAMRYWVEEETHGYWLGGAEAAALVARTVQLAGRWPRVRYVGPEAEELGAAEARRLKRAARDLRDLRHARAVEERRPLFTVGTGKASTLAARVRAARDRAAALGETWIEVGRARAGAAGWVILGADDAGGVIVGPWRFTTEEGARVYLAAMQAWTERPAVRS